MTTIDKVTLEVLKSYFVAVAEAMGHTLERTAHTTFIKESADFATGIATPEGEFFAYPRSLGVSSFVGLDMSAAIGAAGEFRDGDVVITNDPYSTDGFATHLPDIHLIKPIYAGAGLLCYGWCFIHISDVGGLVPASISPRAYDVQQEGLRIPPRKLYREGKLDEDLQQLLLANVRTASQNWGDIQAMVAALGTAERRLKDLVERFGVPVLRAGMTEMLAWSERRARDTIRSIPDGDYAFADYLDDDMSGVPIRLAVTLRVRDDTIVADYSGTDPQVDSAFNLPAFGVRHPFLLQALINLILSEDPSIPITGGLVRPLSVVAPEGTVVSPRFPAAVGVRYATVIRVYNVVLGALAQAIPERVPAAGAGQAAMVMMSVPDPRTGIRSVSVLEPLNGGGGATIAGDGVAGNDSACGFLRNTPIESVEAHVPVLITRYELLAGSAGPGKHRGGWGVVLEFRALSPQTIVTARGMERCRFEPWGHQGGEAAGRTRAYVERAGADAELQIGPIDILYLQPGDAVRLEATGGGGYGPPREREPVAVVADVRAGLLDAKAAAEVYGVALAPHVDEGYDPAATVAMRTTLSTRPLDRHGLDLGPTRRAHDDRWPSDMTAAIAARLWRLPLAWRSWVRRELQERLDAGAASPIEAWNDLVEEFDVLDAIRLRGSDATTTMTGG